MTFMTLLPPLGPLKNVHAQPPNWSSPTALEYSQGLDVNPAALQAADGTMWLAWQTDRYDIAHTGRYDILYSISNGNWSAAIYNNVTNTGTNWNPLFAQLPNGTIYLFWSANPNGNRCIPYCKVYYSTFYNGNWTTMKQVPQTTTSPTNDTLTAGTVGVDGTLWLIWTRETDTCSPGCTVTKGLYYKTLRNGAWAPETNLTSTTDTNWNFGASATVGRDGMVRVVWSKGLPAQGYFQLYYKTYDGTRWSSESLMRFASDPSSGDPSLESSIMQDRNGTFWVFFAREIPLSAGVFQWEIFSSYSYNNGQNWSTPQQIRFESTVRPVDDKMPSAIQGRDKSLYLFYSSDLINNLGFGIYYLKSSPIQPVHEATITSIQTSTPKMYAGGMKSVGQSPILTITVTVQNLGEFNETVTGLLTVSNTTSISLGPQTGFVRNGTSIVLTYTWDTTNVKPARYRFLASLNPLAGETLGNAYPETLQSGLLVWLLPWGDVDQDGSVTIIDASVFFAGYNNIIGQPRYNFYCDINNDGTIDIIDVGIMLKNYNIVT